jgi:hypothetical protein
MATPCKHIWQHADSLYCKKCKSLSEQRARDFINSAAKPRQMKVDVKFGDNGMIVITVTKRPAGSRIVDLRNQLIAQIKTSTLTINDESGQV